MSLRGALENLVSHVEGLGQSLHASGLEARAATIVQDAKATIADLARGGIANDIRAVGHGVQAIENILGLIKDVHNAVDNRGQSGEGQDPAPAPAAPAPAPTLPDPAPVIQNPAPAPAPVASTSQASSDAIDEALNYDRGRRYSVSIIKTIQRVVGAPIDGSWSRATVSYVMTWQEQNDLYADGKVGPKTLRSILDDARIPSHVSPPEAGSQRSSSSGQGITSVGAWATASSLGRHAANAVSFCQQNGLNRLDVFVNGVPKNGEFHMHDADEIAQLCSLGSQAGLQINLTSWIVPTTSFIDAAARALVPLAQRVSAASLIWDAEEPWNRQPNANYDAAGQRIGEAFSSLSCPMGISGIINTRYDRLAPLAQRCEILVPQCYATTNNRLDPSKVASLGVGRWRQHFGANKRFVVGLAGYRQSSDAAQAQQAMNSSLADVRSLGIDTVSYWSLPTVMGSRTVTRVVGQILGED